VPAEVLQIYGQALLNSIENSQKRLLGFGLLEQMEDWVNGQEKSLMVNSLVTTAIRLPPADSLDSFSSEITEILFKSWCQDSDVNRPWLCDNEILSYALKAEHIPAIQSCAENAVEGLDNNFFTIKAAELAEQAIDLLEQQQEKISGNFYRLASDICHQCGKVELAFDYIQKSLGDKDIEPVETASSQLRLGRILKQQGEINHALAAFEQAKSILTDLKKEYDMAIVLGEVARIKVSKGEVDEALQLHQERIQVFEQLGDIGEKAHTLWGISKILLQKDEVQKGYECLAESYQILIELGRLDGICMVGLDLGQLLVQGGHKKDGLEILKRSQKGFKKLGQDAYVEQLEEIIKEQLKSEN